MTSPKRGCAAAVGSILLLLPYPYPALSSNVALSSSSRGRCPGGLKCHHGGVCAPGDKDNSLDPPPVDTRDLPWFEELNVNGYHCVGCHRGWGGVDCGRRYEVCDADDANAPTCFNGGVCYKMGIGASSGKYEYACDCTKAGHGGAGYAGKFCQHLREETCDDEMFCTNGGQCVSVLDIDKVHNHFVCKCPSHRAGTHCEFLQEEGLTECRLDCENGVCARGFKSYDDLIGSGPFPAALARDIASSGGEHCVCPDGWTGLRCEIPVSRCGADRYCYNGSTCAYDEDGEPVCDCNSAHTHDASYAGSGCEQKGRDYCAPGPDQDQKDSFCSNGRCIADPNDRHKGCVCDEGWTGDLCDIPGDYEPACDLDCKNGGSCRFGVKGYKDSYDALNLPVHAKRQEKGMHCSCPDGFTGLKCEVDISRCHYDGGSNSDEHFCLNGVPCAPGKLGSEGTLEKFSCRCGESRDVLTKMLAGRFCEYAVTEFCSKDMARHTNSFCTNGGKCRRKNDHDDTEHHGCCCPEGYEGKYCQLLKGTLGEGTPETWIPLEECKHEKASSPQDPRDFLFLTTPNESGEWPHITINPAFQVHINDTGVDDRQGMGAAPVPESNDWRRGSKKSNAGGIATDVLIVLLAGGIMAVVSTAYRRRSTRDKAGQFDAKWWGGHNVEWWKGEPIEPHTNIAPRDIARTWSYPPDHSMSNDDNNVGTGRKWVYSDDHDDLHDVVI